MANKDKLFRASSILTIASLMLGACSLFESQTNTQLNASSGHTQSLDQQGLPEPAIRPAATWTPVPQAVEWFGLDKNPDIRPFGPSAQSISYDITFNIDNTYHKVPAEIWAGATLNQHMNINIDAARLLMESTGVGINAFLVGPDLQVNTKTDGRFFHFKADDEFWLNTYFNAAHFHISDSKLAFDKEYLPKEITFEKKDLLWGALYYTHLAGLSGPETGQLITQKFRETGVFYQNEALENFISPRAYESFWTKVTHGAPPPGPSQRPIFEFTN